MFSMTVGPGDDFEKLHAKIDALEKKNEVQQVRIEEGWEREKEKDAQIERLREALERIAYGEIHGGDNTDDLPGIAAEALTPTGTEQKGEPVKLVEDVEGPDTHNEGDR